MFTWLPKPWTGRFCWAGVCIGALSISPRMDQSCAAAPIGVGMGRYVSDPPTVLDEDLAIIQALGTAQQTVGCESPAAIKLARDPDHGGARLSRLLPRRLRRSRCARQDTGLRNRLSQQAAQRGDSLGVLQKAHRAAR